MKSKIINLQLNKRDKLKPCPFCGSSRQLELRNTWTPSYWVECACGTQLSGDYFEPRKKYVHGGDPIAHRKSKNSAIKKWNTRAEVGCESL